MNEKVNELFSNKEFVEKLMNLETDAEVQSLLAENGVELSLKEIAMIKKQVEARLSGSEELTDDDLADIAGGSFRSFLESIIQALGTLDTTPLGSKPVRRRW